MRKPVLLPAVGAAALALSGCVPFACPTIGYGNTVEITTLDASVVELDCVVGCEGGVQPLEPVGPVWNFDAPGRPDTITVVGRDADGAEVVREDVPLAWTVADPGNRCGSSAAAAPVTLGG